MRLRRFRKVRTQSAFPSKYPQVRGVAQIPVPPPTAIADYISHSRADPLAAFPRNVRLLPRGTSTRAPGTSRRGDTGGIPRRSSRA